MCERPATSREHVPPKCIFPELKDSGGENMRKDLITVPSCDLHNSEKSRDDEFLMVSLAGIIGNNSIGYRHKFTKVNRAIKNTAGRLLKAVFLKRKHFVVKLEDNAFIELIWGTPDCERLQECFGQIARGLFRHHFEARFQGNLRVYLGYVDPVEKEAATFKRFLTHKFAIEFRGKQRHGANQDVFYYQFSDPDRWGIFSLKMCFYGGADVYVALVPDGCVVPANLGIMLMNRGVKSLFELEGQVYEFN